MDDFNELESDLLREIFNQGMGKAAASLSLMVNDEVKMSVPELSLVSTSDISSYLASISKDKFSGVKQAFTGDLSGSAFLIFSDTESLDLVRIILGRSLPEPQLTGLEEEALNEIANIILNAALGTVANELGGDLMIGLPKFIYKTSDNFFTFPEYLSPESEVVILVKVKMNLENESISGHVLLALDVNSSSRLKEYLDQYIQKVYE